MSSFLNKIRAHRFTPKKQNVRALETLSETKTPKKPSPQFSQASKIVFRL